MRKLFLFYLISVFYMEIVYHLTTFGFKTANPVLLVPLGIVLAGVQTIVSGLFQKKGNRIFAWVLLVLDFVLYFVQIVYISIFDQPLLLDAIINAGQAALTDFGKEAVHGVLACAGTAILLALPFIGFGILIHKEVLTFEKYEKQQWIESGVCTGAGCLITAVILICGYQFQWKLYEEYQSYYDPSTIIARYGVLPSVQRDLLGDCLPAASSALDALIELDEEKTINDIDSTEKNEAKDSSTSDENGNEGTVDSKTDESGNLNPESDSLPEKEELPDTSPNVLNIDFDALISDADTELVKQLAAYMQTLEPTKKNEYTGMFEGYNLIYMTAEGFAPYAVDETLTPTLYKLTHSGFVAEDYYVPLWQTSTSDGEYVNLTGLVPDQQFSMRRTSENAQPFSLPAYFEKEGVKSYAYHNNSLSYYDRYKSHPNLGYDFKAAKSGKLSESEWASQLFEMENEHLWPSSDLAMIKATLPEYIGEERFHAYYMTISGHLEYTFAGNDMSELHQEEVSALPYSEAGRAYVACNMELDRALEYLISELEKAGKLANTVIAISSDHYPYGLEVSEIEEMTGEDLDGSLRLYRNSLILWNSEMETVKIEKPCSAIDLLPTIYNLFGFDYDSRLFAGKDMLSDGETVVVFANQSFITENMSYNAETKELTMNDGNEADSEVFDAMEQKVKGMFEYSAGILNEDFYRYVNDAVTWESAAMMRCRNEGFENKW